MTTRLSERPNASEPASAAHPPGSRLRLGPDVDELETAHAMLNLNPCAIFVKDINARFVAANRAMLTRFGFYDREQIYGLDDFDIHPREQAQTYWAIDHQVLQTGVAVYDLEESQTNSDGSLSLVRTSKVPVRDRRGDIVGLMGFSTDVTEPARVSAALADSEERYALAARATRDGIWDYNVTTNLITMSPRCAQILDVPVVSGPFSWEVLEDRLGRHQSDRIPGLVVRAMADPTAPFDLDLDFEMSDGSTRWVNVVGTVLSQGGEPSRVVGSAEDITDERQRAEELLRQARHDDLTGLQNRRSLLEALVGAEGALLFLDLDSFKVVNDSLGHQAGDHLLIAVADRITDVIDDDTSLYRLGGDEFAIVMPGSGARDPLELADRINTTLCLPFIVEDLEIYTTVSVGIVPDLGDDRGPTELLRDADIALYEAKAAGKAQAAVFESSMRDRAADALELQMQIRRAVEESEFELHYQPITDARSGAVVGVEALIRWRRTDGRYDPPSVFLPYLEESKLIVGVGDWIVETACAQMATWRRKHQSMADVHLALNISRVQFDSSELVHTVSAAIERHGLHPAHVVIEVTETAVTERTAELRTRLDALRKLGIQVAIDDFGVGQSSLSALYDIPADILKIDRSFVERVKRGVDEPVTRAVIDMAQSLGLTTVAEGVENTAQSSWLIDHGCERLQGYLMSRPVPADSVPDLVATLRDVRTLV